MREKKDKIKVIVKKDKFSDKAKSFAVKLLYTLNILVIGGYVSFLFGYSNAFDVLSENMVKQSINDDIVVSVTNYCKYNEGDIDKIYCVNSFVREVFIYNDTDYFVLPDDIIINGGDCKDWTNFYRTVFEAMDIKTKQVFLDTHTYIVAYSDEYYCNIDQEIVSCEVALE